jgi:hypothetical protein
VSAPPLKDGWRLGRPRSDECSRKLPPEAPPQHTGDKVFLKEERK